MRDLQALGVVPVPLAADARILQDQSTKRSRTPLIRLVRVTQFRQPKSTVSEGIPPLEIAPIRLRASFPESISGRLPVAPP